MAQKCDGVGAVATHAFRTDGVEAVATCTFRTDGVEAAATHAVATTSYLIFTTLPPF